MDDRLGPTPHRFALDRPPGRGDPFRCRARPTLRRLPRRPALEGRPTRAAAGAAPLSTAERDRRLAIATKALVRTIRACPAPGVAPLRLRDWLALGAVLVVPFLLGLTFVAAAGR